MTGERLREVRERVHKLEAKVAPLPKPCRPGKKADSAIGSTFAADQGPLQIGDSVRVLSFGQNAELLGLSADRSEADVQMGPLRIRVNVDNLERVSKRQAAAEERGRVEPVVVVPRYEDRPE